MNAISEHWTATGVDDDLEQLGEQITALRELGQRDDEISDEQIYDFSIRWGTALAGRLRRLAHYSALGLLDAADEVGFHTLRKELDEVSTLIDRFNLSRPRLATEVSPSRRHLRTA
ncbi:hypothetical protein [Mycobacterium szulgai]|uniref:Uncharacterized protein n=1 Tax=Mycobacterium szulgai TaxID=1787 RepID=A0A1X2DLX4_MYCSZ|nr:hypothetical protein [Mycobacterium szulgai]MCV7077559.1 hypothetical protein [Mycobacterium szulgai]ORW89040.1 hypothetical protein AWC27_13235 [Mycobacterium szulgai]